MKKSKRILLKLWRSRIVRMLAVIVVFWTNYMLILPAISVDQETTDSMAGFEIVFEQDTENSGDHAETLAGVGALEITENSAGGAEVDAQLESARPFDEAEGDAFSAQDPIRTESAALDGAAASNAESIPQMLPVYAGAVGESPVVSERETDGTAIDAEASGAEPVKNDAVDAVSGDNSTPAADRSADASANNAIHKNHSASAQAGASSDALGIKDVSGASDASQEALRAENANTADDAGNVDNTDDEDSADDADDAEASRNDTDAASDFPAMAFEDTLVSSAAGTGFFNFNKPCTRVSVVAPEGALPAGTRMVAEEVTRIPEVQTAVADAVTQDVRAFVAVDISFFNSDGQKIEPQKEIKVTVTSNAIESAGETDTPVLVHVPEEGKAELVELADGPTAEELIAQMTQGADHAFEGSAASAAALDTLEEVTRVTFESKEFSVYAVVYTVDFAYEGKEFSIPGETFIWLSDLLDALDLEVEISEIENVTFTDETLISVEQVADESASDWRMTSLRPFTSDERLLLALNDGTGMSISVKDEQSRYQTDLAEFLKEITLYIDGEEVTKGDVNVRDGMLYDLTLFFKEDSEKQFDNENQLFFELPKGFVLPDNYADTLTINLGLDGKSYGNALSYDKEKNRLLLDWNKLDRKYQRLIAAGTLQFSVHLQGYVMPGDVTYGGIINIKANRYDPHNASVTKTGVLDATDKEHQMITYTVVVMSDGTTENLSMTDVLGTALSYQTQDGMPSVKWARSNTMSSQSDRDTAEAAVGTTATEHNDAPYLIQSTSGDFEIAIPKMQDGDTITFTYTADVDYTKIAASGSASFHEMGNTVRIFGDSDPIDNKAEFHQKEVIYSDLRKDVQGPGKRYTEEGKEYQNLTWTIETNSFMMISFRGTDITDASHVYSDSTDEPKIMDADILQEYIGDGITIEVYEWDEKEEIKVLKETRHVLWSELGTSADRSAANGWTYHVPDEDGIYEYKITYQTRADVTELKQDVLVKNHAASRGGEDEVSVLLHPKGKGLSVGKRVVSQSEEDITWEITVYLEDIKDGFNDRLVVADLLPFGYTDRTLYKDSYILDSITVTGLQEEEGYDVHPSQGAGWINPDNNAERKEYRYSPDLLGDKDYRNLEGNSNVVYIQFYQDKKKEIDGLLPPEDGSDSRTIKIQLKTSINQDWLRAAWEKYGYAAIWNGLRHENWVYANTAKEKADVITPGKHLVKTYKGIAGWYDNDKPWKKAWRFETYIAGKQPGGTIVIDDYFDPDLWKLYSTDSVQFRAGTEPNYAKSVGRGGKPGTAKTDEFWVEGECGSSVEIIEDGHVRFTIAQMPLRSDGTAWPFYGVNYYLVPKDEAAWETIQQKAFEGKGIAKFINTAESEGLTDSDYYTVELTPERLPLVKSDPSVPDVQNNVTYEIVLNQKKERLNDGKTIVMEDEFANLSIDYSTISITTDPEGKESQVSYDYSGNTGTFLIPDETKVVITYKARVLTADGNRVPAKDEKGNDIVDSDGNPVYQEDTYQVVNTAYMLGWQSGGPKSIKITQAAKAENYRLRLFKYGSGHMEEGLNGAVFELYENKLGEDKQPIQIKDDAGNPVVDRWKNPVYEVVPIKNKEGQTITFTTGLVWMIDGFIQPNLQGKTRGEIDALTDDALLRLVDSGDFNNAGYIRKNLKQHTGYALVELNSDRDGTYFERGKTYYLKEITAPNGYAKDTSTEYYSFTFGEEPKYNEAGVWQYFNNDILKVRNSPVQGAFSLTKRLSGSYTLPDALKSVLRFKVEKKGAVTDPENSTSETTIWETIRPAGAEAGSEGTLTYAQLEKGVVFTNIGEGTFRVTEWMDGDASIPDGIRQIVSYNVDTIDHGRVAPNGNGQYVIEFEISSEDIANGIEHEIELVNTYNEEKVTLLAQKKWIDASGRHYPPDNAKVTFGVYKLSITTTENGTEEKLSGEPIATVELDGNPDVNNTTTTGESSSWVAQFAMLPKADENGEEIRYAVKEIERPAGYDVLYGEECDAGKEYLKLTPSAMPAITNRQQKVSFAVKKDWQFLSWRDESYPVPEGASVTLGVFYGTTAQEAYARFASGEKPYQDITLPDTEKTGNECWTAVFDKLPKADGTGKDYVWILVETKGYAGFTPQYSEDGGNYVILSNAENAENTVTNVEGTKFTFTKIWKDIGQNTTIWQQDIQVTLQSRAEGASNWVPVGTYKLRITENNEGVTVDATPVDSSPISYNWSVKKDSGNAYIFTVSGLEGAVGEGKTRKSVTYSVVEKQAAGYKAPSYAHQDGTVLVNSKYALDGQRIINIPEDSYELPSTGGMGTIFHSLFGSALTALACAALVWKRKKRTG